MTAPWLTTDEVTVWHGDCLDILRTLPDSSVDAVVTDPPYGISFMGKQWDQPGQYGSTRKIGNPGVHRRGEDRENTGDTGAMEAGRYDLSLTAMQSFQSWCEAWARECLRVLKPGGHFLAFGGSRTWHRLAAAVEDAGFEIRDSIAWLYGSGFPKSMNVAKAITGAELGVGSNASAIRKATMGDDYTPSGVRGNRDGVTRRSDTGMAERDLELSDAAKAWEGWGTALKPSFEPIVVGRKPLVGTVAANVLAHGTGALNIAATRTAFRSDADEQESKLKNRHADFGTEAGGNAVYGDFSMVERKNYDAVGRWPSNVVLDESQAAELDAQSGQSQSRVGKPRGAAAGDGWGMTRTGAEYDDAGGASRFFPTFRYEAKAPSSERPKAGEVQHPTVKPLDLMRWLVRLVTPPNGVVLEPFAGSGTTVEATLLEGFRCIAIEREADYLPLIEQRIGKPLQQSLFGDWEDAS